MNCKQVRELLSEYQTGKLNQALHDDIDRHLEKCDHCRSIFEGEVSVSKFLHSEDDLLLPGDITKVIMQKVQQIESTKDSTRYDKLYFLSKKKRLLWGSFMILTFIAIGIVVLVFKSSKLEYSKSYGEVGFTWLSSDGVQNSNFLFLDENTDLQGVIGWGGAMSVMAGSQLEEDKMGENRVFHTYDFSSENQDDRSTEVKGDK